MAGPQSRGRPISAAPARRLAAGRPRAAIFLLAPLLIVARCSFGDDCKVKGLSILARKGRTAMRQPLSVIALLPVAWTLIGLSSAAIALRPFKRIAPLLGRNLGATSLVPLADERALRRATRIGRAVTIAAKYAPFRSNCLPQAMAAALLCRAGRVPYAAHLGASVSEPDKQGELVAHAWVQCGPVAITGGAGSFQRYGVVACFVSRHLAD